MLRQPRRTGFLQLLRGSQFGSLRRLRTLACAPLSPAELTAWVKDEIALFGPIDTGIDHLRSRHLD